MAFVPPASGYDRAITVFSPDGSLYQVQYAGEAVRRGATAIGIKCNEGVVLCVDKRIPSRLVEPESFEKIFQIDDHLAAATSGIIADARILVDRARIEAQIHTLSYDEKMSVMMLAKKIGDLKQMHTQYGGLRPFGASLILAGINSEGPQIFVTEPSGAYLEWKATAIGAGRSVAMEIFEKEYSPEISIENAILLALRALKKSIEGELSKNNVEMAVISLEDKRFKKMDEEKLNFYIEKVKDITEEEDKE